MSDIERRLDPEGEAREVLQRAVSSYGPQVLGNVDLIEGICADQLSDWPREASLIVSAAEVNVAAKLTEQVVSVGPDTAVQLAASTLTDSRSLDPAACQWVVSEFARALGHQVSLPAPSQQTPTPPGPPVGSLVQPPFQPPQQFQPQQPQPQQFETIVPANLSGGYPQTPSGPPVTMPPVVPPAAQQGPARSGRSKGGALIAAAVLALAAIYLVVAAFAKLPPFASRTVTVATISTTQPSTTRPAPPTSTTLAGPLARLQAVVPLVISQGGNCQVNHNPNGNAMAEVDCTVRQPSTIPINEIGYLMYGDSTTMLSAYSTALQHAQVALGSGNCGSFSAFVPPCETTYSVGNVTEGHIFEYLGPNNYDKPILWWTYTTGSDYILMVAGGSRANANGMITWWAVLPSPWIGSSSTG